MAQTRATKNWTQATSLVGKHVVRIETPSLYGTGYLCPRPANKSFLGIATARHVVREADHWQQPIRIHHDFSGETILLGEADRVVMHDPTGLDSSLLVIPPEKLKFPEQPIHLLPGLPDNPVGVEVGWVGYPQMYPTVQCFFSGRISASLTERHTYLLDGVVANGVSGAPVVHVARDGEVYVVGSVTAYSANRQPGATLPGLAEAVDVSHLNQSISEKSLNDLFDERRAVDISELAGLFRPIPPVPPFDK